MYRQALTSVKEEVDAAKSDLAAVVKVENVLLNETVDNSAEAKSGLNKKAQRVQSANQGPKRRNAHRIKGSFSCDKCERKYIRKDSLQRHQTYECGKEPQFSCPFCGQRFKRRSHQLRHISRSHPDKIAILKENNPTLKIETLRF
ncbi:hypothetical protein HUJ05_009017 [Dendroctonus ponderosae]|nr:hypothetical protein HUJ05_009017 [Dendroctonus ponderosae]